MQRNENYWHLTEFNIGKVIGIREREREIGCGEMLLSVALRRSILEEFREHQNFKNVV